MKMQCVRDWPLLATQATGRKLILLALQEWADAITGLAVYNPVYTDAVLLLYYCCIS